MRRGEWLFTVLKGLRSFIVTRDRLLGGGAYVGEWAMFPRAEVEGVCDGDGAEADGGMRFATSWWRTW